MTGDYYSVPVAPCALQYCCLKPANTPGDELDLSLAMIASRRKANAVEGEAKALALPPPPPGERGAPPKEISPAAGGKGAPGGGEG